MRRVIAMVSFVALLTACNFESPTETHVIDEYGSIQGDVKLNDGGVAAGVDIRLSRIESCMFCSLAQYHEVAQTQADAEGGFEFPKVRTGQYEISLGAYEGYSAGGRLPRFNVYTDRATSVTYVLIATP